MEYSMKETDEILLSFAQLLELKKSYIHKRNKHKMGSKHYWRYSGKIETINDLIQLFKEETRNEKGRVDK